MDNEKIIINKNDKYRTLITETIPGDVPIIYTNDNFYKILKNAEKEHEEIAKTNYQKLVGFLTKPCSTHTIPHTFKIRKGDDGIRTIYLIHPQSQINIADFYHAYNELICYYTSDNPISLRSPKKITSTYYVPNRLQNLNKFRTPTVDTESTDSLTKYTSSYFAYRGYDRIYKFYNSPEFYSLESRFKFLWTLDVTKCFDSIYTHSISWACKNKKFIKDNINPPSIHFGSNFDSLMQKCNYNETNGIVIGPEVSRIFAEIIFSDIDRETIKKLNEKNNLKYGIDYEIKRYVDDAFIFADREDIAQVIFDTYQDRLSNYKLSINNQKVTKNTRPFFTSKSKIILAANKMLSEFYSKFSDTQTKDDGTKKVIIKKYLIKINYSET